MEHKFLVEFLDQEISLDKINFSTACRVQPLKAIQAHGSEPSETVPQFESVSIPACSTYFCLSLALIAFNFRLNVLMLLDSHQRSASSVNFLFTDQHK